MYEQREKPKEKIKVNNRPANLTNKAHKLGRIDDDFSAQQSNGLIQRQPRGRLSPIVSDYFQSQSSTIQRMAVGLPAAQMLALISRLLAGLVGGVTFSKSLQALNKSPEFERMTSVQKMMVHAVLYKVANQPKPNNTETLPAEFDAHSTTGGSEITEQGVTTTSQPLTDQAILDLLGPIPASDDMTFVGNTPLPIADDLGLGWVYSQGVRNESVLKAESKALDGSTGTVVRSGATATAVNTATTQKEDVVTKKVAIDPPVQQMNPKNLIPTQTKNEISGSQVKRLKKDMQKNGFDQSEPIDVVKNSRGRLEIEDGHHRTEAAIKAGLDKVPVRVWE